MVLFRGLGSGFAHLQIELHLSFFIDFFSSLTFIFLLVGQTSCAVIDTNLPKCWGRNHRGQLGYEDALNRGDEANEMGDYHLTIDLGTRSSQPIYEWIISSMHHSKR